MKSTGLPFVCFACGYQWGDGRGPAAIRVNTEHGQSSTVEFSDVSMPCPRCRQVNRPALPDGRYQVSEGRWQLIRRITEDLKDAKGSAGDFDTLVRLVREAMAKDSQSQAGAAATIEAKTPYKRIATMVRNHPGVLPVLLAILLWLVPPPYDWGAGSPSPARVTVSQLEHLADREMDELARKIASDIEQDERRKAVRPSTPRLRPQGRNELCRCGSGIKFKKCCGGPHAKAS